MNAMQLNVIGQFKKKAALVLSLFTMQCVAFYSFKRFIELISKIHQIQTMFNRSYYKQIIYRHLKPQQLFFFLIDSICVCMVFFLYRQRVKRQYEFTVYICIA